mmetsp:Transcript_18198/g.54894  ORF Transcript_18198/g.54894 Transcript_18198/m.54894 type:complete len:259 (-) Transcript_18198:657-1433(-)
MRVSSSTSVRQDALSAPPPPATLTQTVVNPSSSARYVVPAAPAPTRRSKSRRSSDTFHRESSCHELPALLRSLGRSPSLVGESLTSSLGVVDSQPSVAGVSARGLSQSTEASLRIISALRSTGLMGVRHRINSVASASLEMVSKSKLTVCTASEAMVTVLLGTAASEMERHFCAGAMSTGPAVRIMWLKRRNWRVSSLSICLVIICQHASADRMERRAAMSKSRSRRFCRDWSSGSSSKPARSSSKVLGGAILLTRSS